MILFVDMDEVIADTFAAHIAQYNLDYNEELSAAECHGNEVWQSVPLDRRESIYRHTSLEGFFRALKPIQDSQAVLKELARKYEVYIASAAMEFPISLREKSEWLDEHFPFIHWKNRILCGDKHILKGDILIDDRTYNLEKFDGRPLLFTSPHNVGNKDFERVNNWQEVAQKLL